MKKTLTTALLLAGTLLYAKGGCTLVQSDSVDIVWQAYKTPEKIGVKGKFPSLSYHPAHKAGKNFKALFEGATVVIDTTKVDSGNTVRDGKLVTYFFKQMKTPKITGKILSVSPNAHTKGKPYTGKLEVALTMNGKTVNTLLDYYYEKELFKAQGNIDLMDFAAGNALKSINRACYDLHKGKTWSDVSIGFVTKVKATKCEMK